MHCYNLQWRLRFPEQHSQGQRERTGLLLYSYCNLVGYGILLGKVGW